jgi:hypothetical protein
LDHIGVVASEGYFSNGHLTKGVKRYTSGKIEYGSFNAKGAHNIAVSIDEEDNRYFGFWKNGVRHGLGVY